MRWSETAVGELARRSQRFWGVGLIAWLIVAACGGNTSNTSGGGSNQAAMNRARAAVSELEAVPTYQGPTESLDTAKVKGKTIYFISIDLHNQFNALIAQNFKEAGDLIGFNTVTLSANLTPDLENTYVEQAIHQHAAGIVLLSIGHETIPNALADAQSAHIPVITIAQYSAGRPIPSDVTNQVTANTYHIGQVQADLAYSMSNGHVHAVAYGSTLVPQDVAQWDGQKAELNSLCPTGCSYKSVNLNLASFPTDLPTDVRSELLADKSLNWFFPDWDILGTYVLAGLKSANAQDRAKFSSWNGIPAAMQQVQAGDEVGTFGVPLRWWGWAAADMIARYVAGQSTPDEHVPTRLFTKSILASINSVDSESQLYQDDGVFTKYKSMWGVSG